MRASGVFLLHGVARPLTGLGTAFQLGLGRDRPERAPAFLAALPPLEFQVFALVGLAGDQGGAIGAEGGAGGRE